MARESRYSLKNGTGGTTASAVELSSNSLSSTYTKLSFVINHYSSSSFANNGLFGRWLGGNGDILFRKNLGTLQLYVYSGAAQWGPASVSGGLGSFEWRGFRFDGSLASGSRLAVFNPSGAKGADAAGPATMDAMSVVPKFGYGGTGSMVGWNGYIRDTALWVGTALPDEVYVAIANGAHPLNFGPTHYWPMDNTLVDLVGGNDLTNMGSNISHSTAQSSPFISLPTGVIVPITSAAVGGDTEISATTDALTLTEQQATISLDIDISATTDVLTLAEQSASVALDVDISASTDALTLTEQQASIAHDVNVQASTDALTLTEQQATITTTGDTNISASTDALTLTEQQATVSLDINISASTDALTLTEQSCVVSLNVDIQAVTQTLTLTEQAAVIAHDRNVTSITDALTLTENAATITATVPTKIDGAASQVINGDYGDLTLYQGVSGDYYTIS